MRDDAVSLSEYWGVVRALTRDVQRCIDGLKGAGAEGDEEAANFWARSLARAVFDALDGVTYRMTFHAYAARMRRDVVFSLEEVRRLERSFDFEEVEEPAALFDPASMLDDIRFAFNAFARVHYADYVLPTGDPEWRSMQEVERIKRSLRFPRSTASLAVTPEQVESLADGFLWFIRRAADLVEVCEKSILEVFEEWEAAEERDDEGAVM